MVWFFERGMEMAVLEVRRCANQFELAVRRADGDEEIVLVPTPRDLLARLEGVPVTLLAEGWRPVSGGPLLSIQASVEQ